MSVSFLEHTVVGSNQFVSAMVRLAALNSLLAVKGPNRKFVGPVHPIDACINVMLIGSTDLEDARDPVINTLLVNTFASILSFLLFNGYLVSDMNESFAIIFDTADCQELAISPSQFGKGRDFI